MGCLRRTPSPLNTLGNPCVYELPVLPFFITAKISESYSPAVQRPPGCTFYRGDFLLFSSAHHWPEIVRSGADEYQERQGATRAQEHRLPARPCAIPAVSTAYALVAACVCLLLRLLLSSTVVRLAVTFTNPFLRPLTLVFHSLPAC